MKPKSRIKIQIVVVGCLILTLCSMLFILTKQNGIVEVSVENVKTTVGTRDQEYHTVAVEGLKSIVVQSVREEIIICPIEGKEITIDHESTGILNKSQKLSIQQKGDTLMIKRSSRKMFNMQILPEREEITIGIPVDYMGDLQVITTSGNITVEDLEIANLGCKSTSGNVQGKEIVAKTVKVTNNSGDCELEDVKVDIMKINTTSGDIEVSGEVESISLKSVSGSVVVDGDFETIDVATTSGRIVLTVEEALKKVKAKSVSGDIRLNLPPEKGVTVDFVSASGRLSGDLIDGILKGCVEKTYGDGSCRVTINTTSGDGRVNWY